MAGRERRGGSGGGCHAVGEEGGARDRVGEGVRHRHDARTALPLEPETGVVCREADRWAPATVPGGGNLI
jgi:hypothetical protein